MPTPPAGPSSNGHGGPPSNGGAERPAARAVVVPSAENSVANGRITDRQLDAIVRIAHAKGLKPADIDGMSLRTFGRNQRMITCECERSDEPSMVQVLHMSNGDTVNEKLKTAENAIAKLQARSLPPEEMLTEAYLSALSRYPTPDESARILSVLEESAEADRRIVWEDIYWGILSSREFLFNH